MGENGKGGLINALQSEIDKIDEAIEKDGAYDKWIKGIDSVIDEYEKLILKMGEAKTAAAGLSELPGNWNDGGTYNPPPKGEDNNNNTNDDDWADDFKNWFSLVDLYATPIGGGSREKYIKKPEEFTIELKYKKEKYGYLVKKGEEFIGYTEEFFANNLKKLGATALGFDTGGYTGDWGPEGKLAMLHQKELVLNQQDTSNLLAAVDMLRTILNTIDIHALNSQLGGILTSPSFHHDANNVLEQNVKIEASFPGVQDRHELEEAFNNLINKAS
jgi:hypothetical protein